MRRSNCSAPIPHGHPRGHHFFCCCPRVLITLIFTCPALYNHQNHPFFECPALFYHTHIFSDPGAARGGWGQNNLTGALIFGTIMRHLQLLLLKIKDTLQDLDFSHVTSKSPNFIVDFMTTRRQEAMSQAIVMQPFSTFSSMVQCI